LPALPAQLASSSLQGEPAAFHVAQANTLGTTQEAVSPVQLENTSSILKLEMRLTLVQIVLQGSTAEFQQLTAPLVTLALSLGWALPNAPSALKGNTSLTMQLKLKLTPALSVILASLEMHKEELHAIAVAQESTAP